jgi:hypothetical protein
VKYPNEVRIILTKARDLIANVGWGKGARALRADGLYTSPRAADVARFCAIGAIDAGAEGYPFDVQQEATFHVVKTLNPDLPLTRALPLWAWNDAPGRSKQEVLEAFDKSIANLPQPTV